MTSSILYEIKVVFSLDMLVLYTYETFSKEKDFSTDFSPLTVATKPPSRESSRYSSFPWAVGTRRWCPASPWSSRWPGSRLNRTSWWPGTRTRRCPPDTPSRSSSPRSRSRRSPWSGSLLKKARGVEDQNSRNCGADLELSFGVLVCNCTRNEHLLIMI